MLLSHRTEQGAQPPDLQGSQIRDRVGAGGMDWVLLPGCSLTSARQAEGPEGGSGRGLPHLLPLAKVESKPESKNGASRLPAYKMLHVWQGVE